MPDPHDQSAAQSLADQMASRRGKRYPAHAYIAETFPDYVKVLLELDEVIRVKPRKFDEKMHELFHIIALAVEMSNPPNQPHLRQHIKKALKLGLTPEEIAEALMVCVNPCGAKVLTYGVTCMLEAIEEMKAEAAGQAT
ncbi:MAG: carboxymuconolactone decarboxylase family protein [Betaproteobacteria bacterium]|jgi:alkylhydroperoxidase/carboxymuconolactone decarboxylase family protein YurZ|nr:carboxymuconolactone decarboxylase family protein [Betaproteobacteria bacterium]MDH4294376.1 carboxymuconolactone decarboxylase family protein [Betaproteobacteria bacterium]MDH5342287.1 carboxymuconolactone decarboxylase family protein [Betaproteobacteria bacterium]